MDTNKKLVINQIEDLKKLTGTTKVVDLANALGIARNTVQNWKIRGKIPEVIMLKAQQIADEKGYVSKENNNFVELDFYDVEVSAGHGALVIQEEKDNSIVFSREFIDKELGVNASNVFLMPVKGDSMIPTLKNKAMIMVNKIEEFSGDGIYVFRFDGQLMVKRLQFTKHGLNVVSDNAIIYPAWELTRTELKTEDFEIIGEVIWSGQRM